MNTSARMTRHLKRGAKMLDVTLRSYMRNQSWCSPDAADWLRRKAGNPDRGTVIPRTDMPGIWQLLPRTQIVDLGRRREQLAEQAERKSVQDKVDRIISEIQGT